MVIIPVIKNAPSDVKIALTLILFSILFILVPPFNAAAPLRILFALLFLLFVPGYALVSLLFPGSNDLTGIERLTLSVVLSIAMAIFDGFALNYTPWGFRPAPIVLSLSAITLALLSAALILRRKIPEEERFRFCFADFLATIRSRSEDAPSDIEKALIIALIASIIVAAGIIMYAKFTFPKERFTSFYILGEGGKAENYTTTLYLGHPASVTVGIENHELEKVNYTLITKLGGSVVDTREITLEEGAKWLNTISFVVNRVGPRMKLEFLLYKEDSNEPYRSLHLWVSSHIDYKHPEILKKYALPLSLIPKVNNSDFTLNTGWRFASNNPYFRGSFFNSTEKPSENSTIKGYVKEYETGLPVSEAHVVISDHYGYVNRTKTDEKGYYELKVKEGHLWLECWKESYEKSSIEFNIAEGGELSINVTLKVLPLFNVTVIPPPEENEGQLPQIVTEELPPEELPPEVVTVGGYVLDNVTNMPVANATVKASHYGFARSTKTDESGYFEFKAPQIGMEIEAEASGFLRNSTWINASIYNIKGKLQTIIVRLTPESSMISGYILDKHGKPIPDANIRVGDHAELHKQCYYNVTRSNSTGYYKLKIPAGHFWMRVWKKGYIGKLTELDIAYGEIKEIDMRLEGLPKVDAVVYGYALCNDTGLPGVKVKLSDRRTYEKIAYTDKSGYYEIKTVPGRFWLFAEPEVYSECVDVRISSKQRMRVDLELGASPTTSYEIAFPYGTRSRYGDYGTIYQTIYAEEEGIATISFKVCDSYASNKSRGYHFKQALLNDVIIWEDDVAGDEGWEEVNIPVTLNKGENTLAFRVYEKQSVGWFPVKVWFDDVKIKAVLI